MGFPLVPISMTLNDIERQWQNTLRYSFFRSSLCRSEWMQTRTISGRKTVPHLYILAIIGRVS